MKDLEGALKDASELYLATDEDREGEAITWHLLEHLKPKIPVKRMVFHEITQAAIDQAVNNPRSIDYGLVDAAETRRILDRLYGYEVSPVLWRRVNRGLSAGRVQSPSIRLIVERERERIAFVSAGYWDIELVSATVPSFDATLVALDGAKVATGKDFDTDGAVRRRPSLSTRPAPEPSPTGSNGIVHGSLGRGEAVSHVAQGPVHDIDAAAGGRPQAPALRVAGDAARPEPVRARVHHLHAYRQRAFSDEALQATRAARSQPSTASSSCRRNPASTRRSQERAGSPRGDPPDHPVARARSRWRVSSTARSWRSTG